MNYRLNDVAQTGGGYGFTILDRRGELIVTFEFEREDKAKEAHRAISQTIAIATNIGAHVPRGRE
jgi:hypothetical protein